MQAFAELAVTTNFSFLRGASHPHELIETAVNYGYAAIGIADRNSLAGVVRAYDALKQMQRDSKTTVPRLLVGARLVFADGTSDILAYPQNRAAYGNLCRLLSAGKMRAEKGQCILSLSDLLAWQDGLLLIGMPPPRFSQSNMEKCAALLRQLTARAAGRVWLASSMLHGKSDGRKLRELRALAAICCRRASRRLSSPR